ncbi:DNA repair protein RadA [Methanospirillum purgamenti]|uniref:DNA repair protein RadA n=1 Tax=Methanospirillum hungatei TaxID=2203 RepID=A0A8F5ZEX1_METHU|nr:DNA repair protein RadA [Methanospirillum hungatei]QXO95247.1 DNA repair protein RadA [Methanospirillum hungatei]
MGAFYCSTCWHVSPSFQYRCPSCGATNSFYTEQQYAELMIRYIHHPLRRYRIIALQNLKQMKWKDAIPDIQERIRIEKDMDVKAEAKKAIEAIGIYHNRTENEQSVLKNEATHMYEHLYHVTCKVIPVRRIIRKRGHYHLRPRGLR